MIRSRLFGLLPLALLAMPGCVPPESSCKESELSGWSVSAPEFSQPIRCDAKIVGHQLAIDATDGSSRAWEVSYVDATVGAVSLAADVDALGSVERAVRIEQGGKLLVETIGALTTIKGDAVAEPGKGQVRRTVRVIVPGGVHYRGQVRAVTWR